MLIKIPLGIKAPRLTSSMGVTTVYGSLVSIAVEGRVCMIHETMVQHRKSILGILHKTNLTVVKVHNCPIYTRCCNVSNTCCFDSSWFWSTVGVILFMVFLGLVVSLYGWYQKKYHRAATGVATNASTPFPASTPNNGIAPAVMLLGPRCAGLQSSLASPKPPAYTSVLTGTTPQPGATGPEVVCQEDPPPYSSMTHVASNCGTLKSVCTQTTTV